MQSLHERPPLHARLALMPSLGVSQVRALRVGRVWRKRHERAGPPATCPQRSRLRGGRVAQLNHFARARSE